MPSPNKPSLDALVGMIAAPAFPPSARLDLLTQACDLRSGMSEEDGLRAIDWLLGLGVKPNVAVFQTCIMHGSVAMVEVLCRMDPLLPVSSTRMGTSHLSVAAVRGEVAMFECLKKHGAVLEESLTAAPGHPILFAVCNNRHEMIRHLHAQPVPVPFLHQVDERGRTPLMSEIKSLSAATVDLLVELGSPLDTIDAENATLADRARSMPSPGAQCLLAHIQRAKLDRDTLPGVSLRPAAPRF